MVAVYDHLFLVDHFNPMIIHIIKMERETVAVITPNTAKRIMLVLPISLLEGMVITISFVFAVVITMDIMVVDKDVAVRVKLSKVPGTVQLNFATKINTVVN